MTQVEDTLKKYGYNPDDFVAIVANVYRDKMNDGIYYGDKEEVVVPKEIADKVDSVWVDFTMTNIRFKDKSGNILLTTVGEGYDDIIKPKAFLL